MKLELRQRTQRQCEIETKCAGWCPPLFFLFWLATIVNSACFLSLLFCVLLVLFLFESCPNPNDFFDCSLQFLRLGQICCLLIDTKLIFRTKLCHVVHAMLHMHLLGLIPSISDAVIPLTWVLPVDLIGAILTHVGMRNLHEVPGAWKHAHSLHARTFVRDCLQTRSGSWSCLAVGLVASNGPTMMMGPQMLRWLKESWVGGNNNNMDGGLWELHIWDQMMDLCLCDSSCSSGGFNSVSFAFSPSHPAGSMWVANSLDPALHPGCSGGRSTWKANFQHNHNSSTHLSSSENWQAAKRAMPGGSARRQRVWSGHCDRQLIAKVARLTESVASRLHVAEDFCLIPVVMIGVLVSLFRVIVHHWKEIRCRHRRPITFVWNVSR